MGIEYKKDPMGHRYVSAEDIRTKLHGSWVYFDGVPVYVKTGQNDDYRKIQIYEMKDRDFLRARTVSVCDEGFNQLVFPMGWFQSKYNSLALYAQRIPVRRYKQGLTEDNLSMSFIREGQEVPLGANSITIDELLRQEFPSVNEALEIVKTSGSCALSSDVALIKQGEEIRVYVGLSDVGRFHPETRTTEVTKHGMYSVISSDLEKAGIQ